MSLHRLLRLGLGVALGLGTSVAWSAPPPAVLPISIGVQTAPDWLLVTAEHLHLFKKVGLRPTFLRFNAGAPMMAAAESGSLDVTTPGTVPFVAGLAQHVPWVAIGIDVYGPGGEGIVVRKGSGIHTIADLKGRKIGYFRASTSQYGLFTALEENHISPSQVTLLSMAPAQQVAAMRDKDIDAAEVWDPWMQKMIHQANGRILATEQSFGVATAGGFFAVRRDWLQTHQETARRFLQAIVMAYDMIEKNPEPAIEVFAKETGIKLSWAMIIYDESPPSDPYKWLDPKYQSSMVPGGVLFQSLTKLDKFLYVQHVTARLADLQGAFDDSVIATVLKQGFHRSARKISVR
jgi:taurine transport system substrate-binding protein